MSTRGSPWPIISGSPFVDAVLLIFLLFGVILAIIFGSMVLIPIGIAIGVLRGLQWYATRPVPTDRLYEDTVQRSISANFPAPDQFMDAYLDRLLEAIRENVPTYSVFQAMAEIAEELYKEERLANPLPPLPPANTIEEGRYRDQLIVHQRKSIDAPRTLDVFHRTLGRAYLDFIAELPSIAKSTEQDFLKASEPECFATFPIIDVLPDAGAAVSALIIPFLSQSVEQLGLFSQLRKQLDWNLHAATMAGGPTRPVLRL
jgi:hypothetical protein